MNWQKACNKSSIKEAFAYTNDGRMIIRNIDGSGIIEKYDKRDGLTYREANDYDLEGRDDWEPLEGDE